jgi:hypothetical protein
MPCLRCMGLLSERGMREEAERYGAAGSNPQVVWPNEILASTAAGYFMQLPIAWAWPVAARFQDIVVPSLSKTLAW